MGFEEKKKKGEKWSVISNRKLSWGLFFWNVFVCFFFGLVLLVFVCVCCVGEEGGGGV